MLLIEMKIDPFDWYQDGEFTFRNDNRRCIWMGRKYYLSKKGYFVRNIKVNKKKGCMISLHREVYEYYSLEKIKTNHDIHHKDENKINNNFINLEQICRKKHKQIHRNSELIIYKCINCETECIKCVNNLGNKYCSIKCNNSYYYKINRTKILKIKKEKYIERIKNGQSNKESKEKHGQENGQACCDGHTAR